jgi:enterochelin esterase-like enzyme
MVAPIAGQEITPMARKRPLRDAGTVVVLEHRSSVLADNPLGDPHWRKLAVWLPPAYDRPGSGPGARYPVLYDLVGFTGSGIAHLNWRPFSDNVAERAARLMRDGHMGPAIIVFPDCYTSLGGNQYVNSPAIGRYADYLVDEVVPFVDREFRTLASREHRGCFGKSSGGYGAMLHGMRYARHWGAIANHSGDAYFDFIYRCDWPNTLNELAKHRRPARKAGAVAPPKDTAAERGLYEGRDDGRVRRFLDAFWKKEKVSSAEVHAIMNLCMAATYDPDPRAPLGFRLPFHLDTGEIIERRWQRWLEHDPVRLVGRCARSLRRLKGIYIDCGWRDQYHIHYGSRQLSRRLAAAGIAHRYEEFDDDHSDIDRRMDVSLPFLYRALQP